MGLETGTYISDLNSANPTAGDPISAGDDHLRLLKATIKATFPSITGAVNVSQTELNYLSGLSSNVQSQLDGKATGVHTHTEDQIADGGIFPRLAATEVISGSWNFTTRPQVNGNGVLDTASSIPETQIADGTVFPRIGANETITGNWAFSGTVNVGGLNVGASPVWHSGNFDPNAYSLTSHLHTGVYSAVGHTHDDRYYTESEVNALLSGYSAGTSGQFTIYLRASNNGANLASGTAYWRKINNTVALTVPELSTADTTSSLVLDGIPAEIQAASVSAYMLAFGWNAGAQEPITVYPVIGGDYFNLARSNGGSFTGTATTKGIRPAHLVYQVI